MIRVNKIAKERYNLLNNSTKDFKAIFDIMFIDLANTLAESNDGFRIYKTTYLEAKNLILDKAYSINMKYPDLKDSFIGISFESSLEWIITFWAIILSGNKPYLINHRHPKELTENILDTLNVKYVMGDNLGYKRELIDYNLLDLKALKDYNFNFANEIALSTSATTLKEKIIIFTGYEISAQILNAKGILKENKLIKKHYHDELKQLVFLPLYHIFGLVAVYLWFSFFGRTLVFLNDYSADTILKTIRKHNVTHIFAVPLFWNSIEREILKGVKEKGLETKFNKGLNLTLKLQKLFPYFGLKLSKFIMRDVTNNLFGRHVYFCITGGGYIKDSTLRLINALGYPLYNGYGMSEIGITSVELSKRVSDRLKNSIGHPFDSVEYKIDNNELYVKGKSISHKAIINKDVVTIALDDYFKTSDIMEYIDDRYYIKGRLDDLYIGPNGENINPDLIEKEINIDSDYVILNYNGELSLIVNIANITKSEDIIKLDESIKSNLSKLDLSLRPSKYYFTFDNLKAKTAIKVSRQYVLKNLNDGKIKLLSKDDININEIESDNPIINKIKELMSLSLNKNVSDISNNSNFFYDLGGSSLEYFDLISRINKEFNISLSFDDIYETAKDLSHKVEVSL